jgi:hypothetical protein
MEVELTPDQWAAVDAHIFACNNLAAVIAIRSFAGVSLHEAITAHVDRYRRLRAESPESFRCTDEEYWRETYS